MLTHNPRTVEKRGGVFRTWHATTLTALTLAVSSFILANWPPIRRATVAELETVSVGVNLLIAGALPWFLQWGVLAIVSFSLIRRRAHLDRRTTVAVVILPLAVGSCWWIGIAATHWGDNPLEAIVNLVMWSSSRAFGAESFVESILHEGLGPLTCPLMLRGPYTLAGWNFLWTALSTGLVTLLWAWAIRTLTDLNRSGKPMASRFFLMGIVILLYDSPILIRCIVRVAGAIQRI